MRRSNATRRVRALRTETILRRIDAAVQERLGRRGRSEEQVVQEGHGIRQVQFAIVVRVLALAAVELHWGAEEEVAQRRDGLRDVYYQGFRRRQFPGRSVFRSCRIKDRATDRFIGWSMAERRKDLYL